MPSIIYIARLNSFSEELAKTLRSAGCYVKSFKPGDITEDECLLAMTSEAIATTVRPDGQTVEAETPGAATLATADVSAQLGSQAAVWNSIKKAVTAESQANRQFVVPVAPAEEPKATPGVTLTRVGRQVASRPQDPASGQIPPSQMIPVSSADVSYPPRKIRATKEQVYRVFRHPLSTVVALLLFSVVYRGLAHPARAEVTSGGAANYHARSDPDSANLPMVLASPGQSAHQSAPLGPSSVRPLKPADDRVQRHLSRNGSVAGDFTNRLALRAQGQATQQNPDLRHPPGSSIQKRIVVD
jgi:hypothetical protein